MRTITYENFLDKVHGCWYGKCLGGAGGAPVEGIKKLLEIQDFTEIFDPDLPNDDLDLQLLWLDVLERKGTVITSCELADAWVEKCWYPFSEYGYFLKNYMRGVKPPYSGILNNEFFKEGMGCPIRSEIWGIISVGNPKLAADYAYLDATLDHADNSVYAEQFLAAMEAEAFFEGDMLTLIQKAMALIPKKSKLFCSFERVLEIYKSGADWTDARQLVLNEYSHPDFTNVVQNLDFILIALLYGKGDLRDTINIALRCGYDTDCTCASAASIVGIMKGYQGLGEELTGLIKDYFVCGIDVVRPSDSILRLAEDSCRIAMQTPNYEVKITDAPFPEQRPAHFEGFSMELATPEGLEAAKKATHPVSWSIYGPFFDQLDQPINPDFPSPHGEGCVLPDLVCMVNNEVFLDRDYPVAWEKPAGVIPAYEDFIDVEALLTLEGQMCCYAKTTITLPEDRKVWAVIGNNDGFSLHVNGAAVLSKDEMRLWTPYNNFTLLDLKKGENTLLVKLLRRGEHLKFSIGFRIYDGGHWHRSKWCTDLF